MTPHALPFIYVAGLPREDIGERSVSFRGKMTVLCIQKLIWPTD
jgi:hypothetical protein